MDADFGFMDERLHGFYKSLLCRGVNVVAEAEEKRCEKHLYIANGSGLSFVTQALRPPSFEEDYYVFIKHNQLSLPLLVEEVLSQVSKRVFAGDSEPLRCHLATNHVRVSSDMDLERLKRALMGGVTSFSIWRDGDDELSEEEVAPINMILRILEEKRGKLTSVSMPKVDQTDIYLTYVSSKLFLF